MSEPSWKQAFQAGVEAMRELAGYVAIHACLVPPDGGSPTEEEREMCAEVARQIYAAQLSSAHATERFRLADIRSIKDRIDARLNNHLCEMEEGYDDSIVGFNQAWDLVRTVLSEELAIAEKIGESEERTTK